jgi:hypothetical protein
MIRPIILFIFCVSTNVQAGDRDHQLYDYWKKNKFHNDENCGVVDDFAHKDMNGYFGGDLSKSGDSAVKKACKDVRTSQSDFNKDCFEALDKAYMGVSSKIAPSSAKGAMLSLKDATEKDCKLRPAPFCELDEVNSVAQQDDAGDLRATCTAHLSCRQKVQVFSNDSVTADGGYNLLCLNKYRENCSEKLTMATLDDCEPVGKKKRVVPRAAGDGGSSYGGSGGSGNR